MARETRTTDQATAQFRQRMAEIRQELDAVNHELGRQDFLDIADRARELLRRTKSLLDGNVNVLFAHDPPRVPENLYRHIDFAQGHLDKALSEEYEFDVIVKRLYMVTSLAQYVLHHVQEAVDRMERHGP